MAGSCFLFFAGGHLFDVRVSKIRSRETRACPSRPKDTFAQVAARSRETRARDPALRLFGLRALATCAICIECIGKGFVAEIQREYVVGYWFCDFLERNYGRSHCFFHAIVKDQARE